MGEGGPHGPPLGVISCHSVVDAPTNSKFLDFSQLHLYFHLVKSFFTFFCNFYKKITIKFFFRPNKQWFFFTKMVKIIFFSQILTFIIWKLYSVGIEKFFEVHCISVCQKMTMLKFVPHQSHFWVSATSRLLLKMLCNSGGWSRAQMKAYDLICLEFLSFGTYGTVPQKVHME